MLKYLKHLVNNKECYQYIIRNVPKLTGEPSLNLHNYRLISKENDKPSMNNFEGKLACGEVSFTLSKFIKTNYNFDNKLDIKFMLSTFGYGKYLEDHLYLKINDIYIIDPTYKQFMTYYDKSGKYDIYLFEKCPFIYVGTDIKEIHEKCKRKRFRNQFILINYLD